MMVPRVRVYGWFKVAISVKKAKIPTALDADLLLSICFEFYYLV
jgi:hypothetical protein